jgi:hypothetical protein
MELFPLFLLLFQDGRPWWCPFRPCPIPILIVVVVVAVLIYWLRAKRPGRPGPPAGPGTR